MDTSVPPDQPLRRLIICFDGTGQNTQSHTNVSLLCEALRGSPGSAVTGNQIVHYEPGIGSPIFGNHISPLRGLRQYLKKNSAILRTYDKAFAASLKEHLLSGYEFLVNTYQNHDKIYIFGYSRGAHLARALAGMLYKVGLVPKGNKRQMEKAYCLYERQDAAGWDECETFKNSQNLSPGIEFLGLWDTVSSVGIIPRYLPFTKVASLINIKYVRHALCLDERRAKFSPDLVTILPLEWDTWPEMKHSKQWKALLGEIEKYTHVREMWFAGCHSDVGGGHPKAGEYGLSRIPLRWMIYQCYETGTGLQFDVNDKRWKEYGCNPGNERELKRSLEVPQRLSCELIKQAVEEFLRSRDEPDQDPPEDAKTIPLSLLDALGPVHDSILEETYWLILGVRYRNPTLPIKMHPTVELREEVLRLVRSQDIYPTVRDHVKRLGLKPYVSKLAQKAKNSKARP